MSKPICFISYASEDISHAHVLYRRLREAGLSPWMDKPPAPYLLDGLKPGELWEDRLREAIRSSKYFLPLFSKISVEKSGYVQSEFRQALTKLAEIPAGKTFVIPVRIEECDIPKARIDGVSFAQYQYIDCFNGYFKDLVSHVSSLEGISDEAPSNRLVEVHSAGEFLEAIASNTEILIKNSFSLTGIEVPNNRHVYAREVFDGEEFVFRDLENFRVKGVGSPEITVSPRYATTLNFEESHGVNIEGFTIGHGPDVGECAGAVINFLNCSSVNVQNSRLFGCGTYGFQLVNCEFVNFTDCKIFECSYGMFTAKEVSSLKLVGVEFYDNRCFTGMELVNTDALFENCKLFNNVPRFSDSRIFQVYRSEVSFFNTSLELGKFSDLGIPNDQDGLTVIGLN